MGPSLAWVTGSSLEHGFCLASATQGPRSFKGCRPRDGRQVAPEPAPARGRDSAGSAGVGASGPRSGISSGNLLSMETFKYIQKQTEQANEKANPVSPLPPPMPTTCLLRKASLRHPIVSSRYKIRTLKKKPQSQCHHCRREQAGICSIEVGVRTSRLRWTVSQRVARSRAEPLFPASSQLPAHMVESDDPATCGDTEPIRRAPAHCHQPLSHGQLSHIVLKATGPDQQL